MMLAVFIVYLDYTILEKSCIHASVPPPPQENVTPIGETLYIWAWSCQVHKLRYAYRSWMQLTVCYILVLAIVLVYACRVYVLKRAFLGD